MRSYENVIVTVCLGNEQYDMELPSFIAISDLKRKMIETFCVMHPQVMSDFDNIEIEFSGKTLDNSETLASNGVWDGSIINCICKKGAAK